MLEADDSRPAAEVPGHLDRVLDRFSPAVEQKRLLRVSAWSYPVQPFGQLDIGLVSGHRKADVGKALQLAPDRVHHPGMPMPSVHHPDAAGKVDQAVPVGIGDHRSFSMHHGDRSHGWHPPRNRGSPSLQKGPAGRSWDLGSQLDDGSHHTSAG